MQAMNGFWFERGGRALVVIGAHLVIVYLIATSLGIVPKPMLTLPMEATIIELPQQSEPMEPALVKPELVEPVLDMQQPDLVPIPEIEVPTDVVAAPALSAAPTEAVESTELAVSSRIAPAYPAQSRREGEQGVVTLRVLVDERGRTVEVNVQKSSGFPRLDAAALQAIRRWTFVPPTRNGQPVRSWSRVQVRFQLSGG